MRKWQRSRDIYLKNFNLMSRVFQRIVPEPTEAGTMHGIARWYGRDFSALSRKVEERSLIRESRILGRSFNGQWQGGLG
jgi:hypothetical protein